VGDREQVKRLREALDHDLLGPVYAMIERVKAALDPQVALLGFCGARGRLSFLTTSSASADSQKGRQVREGH
jgi:hypothetical protein